MIMSKKQNGQRMSLSSVLPAKFFLVLLLPLPIYFLSHIGGFIKRVFSTVQCFTAQQQSSFEDYIYMGLHFNYSMQKREFLESKMGETESKMGEWESKIGIDLSSIKEKQNRQKKKQILSQGLI